MSSPRSSLSMFSKLISLLAAFMSHTVFSLFIYRPLCKKQPLEMAGVQHLTVYTSDNKKIPVNLLKTTGNLSAWFCSWHQQSDALQIKKSKVHSAIGQVFPVTYLLTLNWVPQQGTSVGVPLPDPCCLCSKAAGELLLFN